VNTSFTGSKQVDEQVIRAVVDDFYRAARRDSELGPVFAAHVEDWERHLETMRNFWATVLLGERNYTGNPFLKHSAVPELNARHFRKWLALFSETLTKHCDPTDAAAWEATARRMGFAMSSRLGFRQIEDLLS
jgi:hemoglobin